MRIRQDLFINWLLGYPALHSHNIGASSGYRQRRAVHYTPGIAPRLRITHYARAAGRRFCRHTTTIAHRAAPINYCSFASGICHCRRITAILPLPAIPFGKLIISFPANSTRRTIFIAIAVHNHRSHRRSAQRAVRLLLAVHVRAAPARHIHNITSRRSLPRHAPQRYLRELVPGGTISSLARLNSFSLFALLGLCCGTARHSSCGWRAASLFIIGFGQQFISRRPRRVLFHYCRRAAFNYFAAFQFSAFAADRHSPLLLIRSLRRLSISFQFLFAPPPPRPPPSRVAGARSIAARRRRRAVRAHLPPHFCSTRHFQPLLSIALPFTAIVRPGNADGIGAALPLPRVSALRVLPGGF